MPTTSQNIPSPLNHDLLKPAESWVRLSSLKGHTSERLTQFFVPPPDTLATRQLHSKLRPPDGKQTFQIVSCKLQAGFNAWGERESRREPGCLEEGWKVWGHIHFQSLIALSDSVPLAASEGESNIACHVGRTVLGGTVEGAERLLVIAV